MSDALRRINPNGAELSAPAKGDLVTVLIRPPKAPVAPWRMPSITQDRVYEVPPDHENPSHYRIARIWRVVEANEGHATLKQEWPEYERGRVEIVAVSLHRWFDATATLEAVFLHERDPQP